MRATYVFDFSSQFFWVLDITWITNIFLDANSLGKNPILISPTTHVDSYDKDQMAGSMAKNLCLSVYRLPC